MKHNYQLNQTYNIKEYYCKYCGNELKHSNKYMTSFPINTILECPNCQQEYYFLIDKILCTPNEYQRMKKYYEWE